MFCFRAKRASSTFHKFGNWCDIPEGGSCILAKKIQEYISQICLNFPDYSKVNSDLLISHGNESNFVIITNKDRVRRFFKIYKKTFKVIVTPITLLPIAFIGENNAYLSFYIFLLSGIFVAGNFLHPGIISFIPLAYFTTMEAFNRKLINTINLSNSVLDCLGVMMIILAMEHCHLHRRIALKILIIFGCSHFRLSFLLFLSTTTLSLWFTNCMACGLMMPLVKAILKELEKMGILETHVIIGKASSDSIDEKYVPRPSDFTVFYFIGIAYSSIIGGMATLVGSETNRLFINYSSTTYPGLKLEFPHLLLLTLPGVLIMEMFLYLWLNFYVLGILRVQNYTALQASLTSEEEQFISVLLRGQYDEMGKMRFQEMVVATTIVLAAVFQAIIAYYTDNDNLKSIRYATVNVPCMICIVILFLTPTDLSCLKFCKRRIDDDNSEPLPISSSKGCLTWAIVTNNINWSVLFITASANVTFESLEVSKMAEEFEKFLLLFSGWPPQLLACVVIVFCKILTEFASDGTVVQTMLVHIANVGVKSKVNPLYLTLGATLSSSLPFHLITGSPVIAMISAYVHIPTRKLIIAGIGPSVLAVLIHFFTVCVWSKVIWPDLDIHHK